MPQDTIWTGDYIKAIETAKNDTSFKEIHVAVNSNPLKSENWTPTFKNITATPLTVLLFIVFIIIANLLYKKKEGISRNEVS